MTTIDAVSALTGTYTIDAANSRIGFAARYAMVSTVRGYFSEFDAQIELNGDDPSRSSVALRISADSLQSGQAQRDDHLRSADFLDVHTYPELTFRSTGVTGHGDGRYQLAGELTVRDVTRPITLDFLLTGTSTDHRGYELLGFTGAGRFSRAAFGLTWNTILETGGVLVGDQVDLDFEIALIRNRPTGPARGRWWASRRRGR